MIYMQLVCMKFIVKVILVKNINKNRNNYECNVSKGIATHVYPLAVTATFDPFCIGGGGLRRL